MCAQNKEALRFYYIGVIKSWHLHQFKTGKQFFPRLVACKAGLHDTSKAAPVMKLLTVNFLACAVKSCKSSLSSSSARSMSTSNDPPSEPPSDELSPFPLHFRDAVLERTEINYNPRFIQNILPRVNWDALKITAKELGLLSLLPESNPADDPAWDTETGKGVETKKGDGDVSGAAAAEDQDEHMEIEVNTHMGAKVQEEDMDMKEKVLRQLHTLLLETSVSEGKLACGKCGFEYPIKEGVGNFLLPAHLGKLFLYPPLASIAFLLQMRYLPMERNAMEVAAGWSVWRVGGLKGSSKADLCPFIHSVTFISSTKEHSHEQPYYQKRPSRRYTSKYTRSRSLPYD